NQDIMDHLNIPASALQAVIAKESEELARRERVYRGSRPPLNVDDRIVILIDDGFATGSTMLAAITALKKQRASRLVVAVPVGATETCHEISAVVDELICLATPDPFFGVGRWYESFPQTSDEEVQQLLSEGGEP